jgi:glucose/arabinose dehydrogenase
MKHGYSKLALSCAFGIQLGGCNTVSTETAAQSTVTRRTACDADNGSLTLPSDFCASVFADQLGHARHIAVAPNGDVYVNTWSSNYNKRANAPGGYVVALAERALRHGAAQQRGARRA